MDSNKTTKNLRGAVIPQRSHGKARVAAVLEAAAAVIAEEGYDAATMAQIAARARSPIGSLYRFFPNKEILAEALIRRYAVLVNEAFDTFDRRANETSFADLADDLLDFIVTLQGETRAMRGLLEARADWSDKRLQFRNLALRRLAKTILLHAPAMSPTAARDVAVILLLNMKTMAALKSDKNIPNSPGAVNELRHMNRLYLINKLGTPR
jgi:AcrR family transcriptional regulator